MTIPAGRVGKWNGRGRIVHEEAVTPNDSTLLQWDYLYVGTGGDVAYLPRDSAASVVKKNVGSGQYILANVKKVLSTGTTASDILGGLVEFNN